MKNVALCLGCDDYAILNPLNGAVADCERTYEALVGSGLYDPNSSKRQLSPTLQQMRSALNEIAGCRDLEVLTFYFAGHGGMKAGTFYLCGKDADPDRLSTTAFPILDLFTIIGEIQPRQANIVIDACESASAMFDLNALMKPDVIGRAGSSSIAFLAACASDQYAGETLTGGIATIATHKYLTGERQLQNIRPYLDLVEVGLAVSRDVRKEATDQSPVAWGLNLYGDGIFATNPHYGVSGSGPAFSVEGIAPASTAGKLVSQQTEALWEEYRAIASDPDPRRLRALLVQMRGELGDDFAPFIRGYALALAGRAGLSEDLLAASDAIGVCAVALLPQIAKPAAAQICHELLRARTELDHRALADLRTALEADRFSLLSRGHALADLHYLPMRASQLLAWLALSRHTNVILGVQDTNAARDSDAIVSMVFQHYRHCFVAISDEQAAWTWIFGALAAEFGWGETLNSLAGRLFATEQAVRGRVLRPGASGNTVFNYSLVRAGTDSPISYDELANPTELLSVLLLIGHRLGLSDSWDTSLQTFDGLTLNAFVPEHYSQFGEPFIAGGNNFTFRIGHDVWRVGEFVAAYEKAVVPAIVAATGNLAPEALLLCGLAAYLFPDRVPYLMQMPPWETARQLG